MNKMRNRQKHHAVTVRTYTYYFKGQYYDFPALNVSDAMSQLRTCLSATAAREAQLTKVS